LVDASLNKADQKNSYDGEYFSGVCFRSIPQPSKERSPESDEDRAFFMVIGIVFAIIGATIMGWGLGRNISAVIRLLLITSGGFFVINGIVFFRHGWLL
jgi:hypothetical protein